MDAIQILIDRCESGRQLYDAVEAETRSNLIETLLEALGWDIHDHQRALCRP